MNGNTCYGKGAPAAKGTGAENAEALAFPLRRLITYQVGPQPIRKRVWAHLALGVLLAMLSVSCTDTHGSGAGASKSGANGTRVTRVIDNARPVVGEGASWASVGTEPTLRLGLEHGAAPYLFASITGALELPSGEIVVSDGATREIRIFDSSGRHLHTFGGRGQGPGEFRGAPLVRVATPGTLLAWDSRLQRLTWFTVEGELLKDRLISTSTSLPISNYRLHPSGYVIWQEAPSRVRAPDGLLSTPMSLAIVKVEPESVRWRWIRDLPGLEEVIVGSSRAPAIFQPTAGNNWAVRVDPPTIVVADDPAGDWALSVYDLDGKLQVSIRAPVPRREITDDLARMAQQRLLDQADTLLPGDREDFRVAVQQMPVPERAPAISSVIVDAANRLWVKRWAGFWEELQGEGNDRYDVIDPDGVWLGVVEVSRAFGQIASVGSEHILFLSNDLELVPQVRRHDLYLDLRGR